MHSSEKTTVHPSERAQVVRFALRAALFIVLMVVIFESIFRFILVPHTAPTAFFDQNSQLMHYDPSQPVDGVYSFGRFTQHQPVWHVNRAGWVAPVDYLPTTAKTRPRIGLIGDSYVEGLHVSSDRNARSQLEAMLGGMADVYSFAYGGASLAQDLRMALDARDKYQIDAYVFFVVRDDIEQSLEFDDPTFWKWKIELDTVLEAPPIPFRPSRIRRLVGRSSAFISYLYFQEMLQKPVPKINLRKRVSQTFSVDSTACRTAARYFLKRLERELPDAQILLLLDSDRFSYFDGKPAQPMMHQIILNELQGATRAKIIDLDPIYLQEMQKTNRPLQTPDNPHLNSWGHYLLAKTIRDQLDLTELSSLQQLSEMIP